MSEKEKREFVRQLEQAESLFGNGPTGGKDSGLADLLPKEFKPSTEIHSVKRRDMDDIVAKDDEYDPLDPDTYK